MMDKRFNSEEELDNYLLQNKTPFSVIDQKIDYSLIKKSKKKHGISLKTKLITALASVVLIVTLCLGGYFISGISKKTECPFELGTYIYASHEGTLDDLDFSEKSYIVLTEEELSGPGAFVIEDEDNDWVVYGKFNDCFFSDIEIERTIWQNGKIYFSSNDVYYEAYYAKHNGSYELTIYLQNEEPSVSIKVDFILNK